MDIICFKLDLLMPNMDDNRIVIFYSFQLILKLYSHFQ